MRSKIKKNQMKLMNPWKKNGEEVNESNEEKVEADENESNEEKAIIKVFHLECDKIILWNGIRIECNLGFSIGKNTFVEFFFQYEW